MSLLLSLRLGPAIAFAPPFTLTRLPALLRVFLVLGLCGALAAGRPVAALAGGGLVVAAVKELVLGLALMSGLQMMFGALYVAGRTLDIQAGYGLATLIDPTSQAQTPLIGTLFAYVAGLVFLGLDGHLELLRIVQASLDVVPLGVGAPLPPVSKIAGFLTAAYALAFGVAGGGILALFLVDLAIALMARTLPQMNVLMLGFQVKTLVLLVALPVTLGGAGALLVRLSRLTLESLPGLL